MYHRRRLFILSTGAQLRDYIRVTCLRPLNITEDILSNTLLT